MKGWKTSRSWSYLKPNIKIEHISSFSSTFKIKDPFSNFGKLKKKSNWRFFLFIFILKSQVCHMILKKAPMDTTLSFLQQDSSSRKTLTSLRFKHREYSYLREVQAPGILLPPWDSRIQAPGILLPPWDSSTGSIRRGPQNSEGNWWDISLSMLRS